MSFMKPSSNEEEYFLKHEAQLAKERRAKLLEEEKAKERALHFMKCPKCGMDLETVAVGSVNVDKCTGCAGIWLDAGELEAIEAQDAGFIRRLFKPLR
jgi:uncharacterized protein